MGERGKLIVLSMEKFEDCNALPGNKYDAINLEKTFTKFGASVSVYRNYRLQEIKDLMAWVEQHDYSHYSYLAVAITSHGARRQGVNAYDKNFNFEDQVVFPIQRNKTLRTKPKLFIIDTCRGSSHVDQCISRSHYDTYYTTRTIRYYATPEGKTAISYANGSLFIQTFCKKIQKYGSHLNVLDIIEKTSSAVYAESGRKQLPVLDSSFLAEHKPHEFYIGGRRSHSRERNHGHRRNSSRERRSSTENLENLYKRLGL